MRTLTIATAILAFSTASAASAQEAHWGDSGAAIFNVPMGYGSQADLNGAPGTAVRDRKKKRPRGIGRVPNACVYDGANPRPDAVEFWGVAQGPCGVPHGVASEPVGGWTGTLTVETTGAWTTVVVETKNPNGAHQPEALNGGLDLD